MASKDWLAKGHKGKRDQAQKTLSYIGKPDNRNRMEFGPTTSAGKFYDSEAIPKFDKFDAAVGIWENRDMRNKYVIKAVEDTEKYLFRYTGKYTVSSAAVSPSQINV